jgi:hypothetical protein
MNSTEFRECLCESVYCVIAYTSFLFSYSGYSHLSFLYDHTIIFLWSVVIFWWHLILNDMIEQTIISRKNICDRNSTSIRYLKWNPKFCNMWNHKKHKERYKTTVLVTSCPYLSPSSEDIQPSKSTSIFTKRKLLTEHVLSVCVCMWVTRMSKYSGVIMTHCCCRLCGSESE